MSAIIFAALFSQRADAELIRWTADSTRNSERLKLTPAADSPQTLERIGDLQFVRLRPSDDLYSRSAFHVAIAAPGNRPSWLVLEFLDRGFGLISATPAVPDPHKWGIARVNSGKVRRAAFQFDGPTLPKQIRIEGLDWLRGLEWTDAKPTIEPAPLVGPALKFTVASERVTTACIDGPNPENLDRVLAGLRNHLPLARALGFNGVETFLRWGWVEQQRGRFDWRYFDRVLEEIERHGMKWSPMLLAGSGYAVPAWLHDSADNVGFKCLEHGIVHDTQSIFHPFQADYARRFLTEFGKHYRSRDSLLAIRLGPSGDFGEAQYPARGPGYNWRKDGHTHIGYWAADKYAVASFQAWLRRQYGEISRLNIAWESNHASFEQIRTVLPVMAVSRRQRLDFATWYMESMSDWCQHWAEWSRGALPKTSIHQSAGGWGPVEIGTDYTAQAKGMAKVNGGIRLTNEGDDFVDNFTITRMASSAARFYGVRLGYEPAGFGSKRGVMARLFNAITNGATHLFYYQSNLTANDQVIDAWLKHGSLLDQRSKPMVEVAAFYPDTAIKLDDEVVRYRFASTFFTVARAVREHVDFDFASEQMIADGALDRYKVLLLLWGPVTEKPVLEKIDRWVRAGGTLIVAPGRRGHPASVEGDMAFSNRWLAGDTGKGRYLVWRGEPIPSASYAEFIQKNLLAMPALHPRIQSALRMQKPADVYWVVLENGKLAVLNTSGRSATVHLVDGTTIEIPACEMAIR